MMTWYIGMATMVMIGVIKLVLSFCGGWVQKMVPQAGLLGSLAGIGLALIGFVPLLDIFGMPRHRPDLARPDPVQPGGPHQAAEEYPGRARGDRDRHGAVLHPGAARRGSAGPTRRSPRPIFTSGSRPDPRCS